MNILEQHESRLRESAGQDISWGTGSTVFEVFQQEKGSAFSTFFFQQS